MPDTLFWGIIIALLVTLCAVWVVGVLDYREIERRNEELRAAHTRKL